MKKIIKAMGVLLAVTIVAAQSLIAFAEETTTVNLTAEAIKESGQNIKAVCSISGAGEVSNGKIRIKYDGGQLHLKSDAAGAALKAAMCEINDCQNGNKEEGEIVFAFASAAPLKEDGAMLEMEFQVADTVTKGDTINITADVEKMAGDQGDIKVENAKMSVQMGEANQGQDQTPGGTDADKDPSGIGGNESQDSTDSQVDTGKKAETKKQSQSASAEKSKSVKTGDETNVTAFIVIAGIMAAVIAAGGFVIYRQRRNSIK